MKMRPRQTERLYAHRARQDGEEMQRRADRVERAFGGVRDVKGGLWRKQR